MRVQIGHSHSIVCVVSNQSSGKALMVGAAPVRALGQPALLTRSNKLASIENYNTHLLTRLRLPQEFLYVSRTTEGT